MTQIGISMNIHVHVYSTEQLATTLKVWKSVKEWSRTNGEILCNWLDDAWTHIICYKQIVTKTIYGLTQQHILVQDHAKMWDFQLWVKTQQTSI